MTDAFKYEDNDVKQSSILAKNDISLDRLLILSFCLVAFFLFSVPLVPRLHTHNNGSLFIDFGVAPRLGVLMFDEIFIRIPSYRCSKFSVSITAKVCKR